jgi:hypothetical protein
MAMGGKFHAFPTSLSYDPGLDTLDAGGWARGVRFLGAEAHYMHRAIRAQLADLRAVFGDDCLLPPVDDREGIRR